VICQPYLSAFALPAHPVAHQKALVRRPLPLDILVIEELPG
jgi:hypothetical protein